MDIETLTKQLIHLQEEFKLNKEEISEAYVKCSGDFKKMRKYLKNASSVVTWDYLEDLALQYPDDSQQFLVLLSEKGMKEIIERRQFLVAEPQYAPE